MKIDYAIMSADDNPMYLDFWPLVSKLWRRMGITPLLLYFGEEKISNESGDVLYPSYDGMDLSIATCWSRYWLACDLKTSVSIITDIDMLPIDKGYFVNQLQDYNNKHYIHLNPCIETYSRLPSCYHVAKGNVFTEVLQIDSDWEQAYADLVTQKYDNSTCRLNEFWCYDEFWATEKILSSDYKYIELIKRDGGEIGHRLDRTNWVYDDKVKYYDSHSLRPYSQYKEQIHDFLNKVLC